MSPPVPRTRLRPVACAWRSNPGPRRASAGGPVTPRTPGRGKVSEASVFAALRPDDLLLRGGRRFGRERSLGTRLASACANRGLTFSSKSSFTRRSWPGGAHEPLRRPEPLGGRRASGLESRPESQSRSCHRSSPPSTLVHGDSRALDARLAASDRRIHRDSCLPVHDLIVADGPQLGSASCNPQWS